MNQAYLNLLLSDLGNIEKMRRDRGLSIREISKMIGVHSNTWINWKRTNFQSCQVADLRKIYQVLSTNAYRVA